MYYLGIDLGAGSGAKLGLFEKDAKQIDSGFLPIHDFNSQYQKLVSGLCNHLDVILKKNNLQRKDIRAIGFVSPGIFKKDGTYIVTSGFDFLNHKNLRADLEKEYGKPVFLENDVNAGGLAEWNTMQKELLYWVFGGGWGGAWVSKKGEVLFPATDWDGKDESLHLTNEPGYATPLLKEELKKIFNNLGFDYGLFEENLRAERGESALRGPSNQADMLRAELMISGNGIFRLFKSNPAVKEPKYQDIKDISVAGKQITELANRKDILALDTYQLFGEILAMAGEKIIKTAVSDGASQKIPVYIAGKPASAFPYFASSAQAYLQKRGCLSEIQISELHQKGINANLVGAAVLAEKH